MRGSQGILGGEPHLHAIQSLYCRCVSMDCMAGGLEGLALPGLPFVTESLHY